MENSKLINTLKSDDQVEGVYFLKKADIKTTSKGIPYLWAVLSDSSGTVTAIRWNYEGSVSGADKGSYVHITGKVTTYNEELQITLGSICIAASDDREENADAPEKKKVYPSQRCAYVISYDSQYHEGQRLYLRLSGEQPTYSGVTDINDARWFRSLETAREKAKRMKHGNPRIERYEMVLSEAPLEIFDV